MPLQSNVSKLVVNVYSLESEDIVWILCLENEDPWNVWRNYRERLKELNGEENWRLLPDDEVDELEEAPV